MSNVFRAVWKHFTPNVLYVHAERDKIIILIIIIIIIINTPTRGAKGTRGNKTNI